MFALLQRNLKELEKPIAEFCIMALKNHEALVIHWTLRGQFNRPGN